MDWLFQTLKWYSILLMLGLIFFPLTAKIFAKFHDRGYPFSKTIAILILSYTMFLLGILKLAPFSLLTFVIFTALFAAFNIFLLIKNKVAPIKGGLRIIIFEELLFVASLLFLSYVRGQEPAIRGLEKFMDFGFINSILRSDYFPPIDMWLSADASHPNGYSINYYYFGHLTGALLIKLTSTLPSVGYNLILATIFAQAITIIFSLVGNFVALIQHTLYKKIYDFSVLLFGLIGSFIVNLGGNLHTIYLFTTGYPNEQPIPFWQILSSFNPAKYWYPNATRFIPYTIHEFPSYSYVVADLHGHVFDIPFVLLTLGLLFLFFIQPFSNQEKYFKITAISLGFLTAIHYMTNAFDGLIYLLLTSIVFFIVFKISKKFLLSFSLLIISFVLFSLPFSAFFSPFATGIGVNCSPDFLIALKHIGPFLFEKNNCQVSAPWMLFILWGFFWISLIIFVTITFLEQFKKGGVIKKQSELNQLNKIDFFMLLLFMFGTILIIIPEFFYVKDIYPLHFRANTMFKLGYQAFIMMGLASAYVLYRIRLLKLLPQLSLKIIYILFFFFIFIYPFFAFPSFYGKLAKNPQLDGSLWINNSFPEDLEIIKYLNINIKGHPVILEAQGDSYTDYERISAYTGLPTVAGWWVHEWLWRGSSNVVGARIPDIVAIYESRDIKHTKELLKKYRVRYVIVSSLERTKYPKLDEKKFSVIGKQIFSTSNQRGALYQVD